MELPDELKRLLDGPNFASVATLMPDGSPQATTMWIDRDGDQITFNTAEGRIKPRNLRRDPRVAIAIHDADKPYKAAAVRGHVIEMRQEGADDHIDRLAQKYLGEERYPWRSPDMQRLTVVVEASSISIYGR